MRWVLTEAADPDQEEGSWLEMLTTAEQQELRQIEQGLRAHERGYARRLTLVQGLLRWAAPAGSVTCSPWPPLRGGCRDS